VRVGLGGHADRVGRPAPEPAECAGTKHRNRNALQSGIISK
jgi:hypothetical protein